MKHKAIIILIFLTEIVCAQNRNSVWCFGDSAGIDFSSGTPVVFSSGMDGRGSCVSVADQSGKLLYYTSTLPYLGPNAFYTTYVFDSTHSIMQNGDTLFGHAWYHELVTFPNPSNDSTYYIFSIGVTSVLGLFYSVIDMRLNNGLGSVVQKNIQLQSFEQVDCLNAIKHGNGKDWWLIFRRSQFSTGGSNNDWYTYLITADSIQSLNVQTIGSQNSTNNAQVCFSPQGDKLAFSSYMGLLEIYDFDRCTGLLSNNIIIEPEPTVPPAKYFWSCAFSPDASKLYVSTNETPTYLFQYDLNAANIPASKDTIWSLSFPLEAGGQLKLAPDDKIYLANWYFNGITTSYPYPDSMYNTYNMNLSVINQPDSLGAACDFQPYSFYLGGKRTYVGLPNNPDYELEPLLGSPCDTLGVGVYEILSKSNPELFVFYHHGWQKAFINAKGLKGNNYTLKIVDMLGKNIYQQKGLLNSEYFTKDLNCSSYAKGVYIAVFQTDREKLLRKFIIE